MGMGPTRVASSQEGEPPALLVLLFLDPCPRLAPELNDLLTPLIPDLSYDGLAVADGITAA